MGLRELEAAAIITGLSFFSAGCSGGERTRPSIEVPIQVWENQFGNDPANIDMYSVPSVDGHAFEMEDTTGAKYAYVAWDRNIRGVYVLLPKSAKKDVQEDGSMLIYSLANNLHVAGYTDENDGVKGYLYPQLGAFIYLDSVPAENEAAAKRSVFDFGGQLSEFVRQETTKAGKNPISFALHPKIDSTNRIIWTMIISKGGKTFVIDRFP